MDASAVIAAVEARAPREGQAKWDRCGVQIAGARSEVRRLAVALDPVPALVEKALAWGADMILTHHPVSLSPRLPDRRDDYHEVLRLVLSSGTWLYAAHTSLDVRPDGPASWLGRELGLSGMTLLEASSRIPAVEIFFHPAEPVARSVAEAWADHPGVRQLAQDRTGVLTLVCDGASWPEVRDRIAADLGARPTFYQRSLTAPAEAVGFGAVGDLPAPLPWKDFLDRLSGLTGRKILTLCGPAATDPPRTVGRVAFCPGSGSSLAGAAHAAGADVLVTGDVKYHQALSAELPVVDVGHFALEEEMMRRFAALLAGDVAKGGVDVEFFAGTEPYGFFVRGGSETER